MLYFLVSITQKISPYPSLVFERGDGDLEAYQNMVLNSGKFVRAEKTVIKKRNGKKIFCTFQQQFCSIFFCFYCQFFIVYEIKAYKNSFTVQIRRRKGHWLYFFQVDYTYAYIYCTVPTVIPATTLNSPQMKH